MKNWIGRRRGPFAVTLVLAGACLLQSPGRIAPETKLDMALDPLGFMTRALHLWEPRAAFGHIQNQSVGYLFPMGPFFALGKAAGIPMWIVQRMWMTAIVAIALWGVLRVAEALEIGTPATRLAGATVYALSPAMLTLLAYTSGGQLPGAILPWALLPLITGATRGSPRRAAARSGLAVAAMGGINAVSTLSVLLLPAVWLLTRTGRRARVMLAWWIAAVTAACLWWLVPLILQVHYGVDFLPYTESAATTTATASAVEAMRGTGHWLAYLFTRDHPWLPGGWALASVRVAVASTVALAAGGIWGLARRDVPQRVFLVLGVAVGLCAVSAGYGGQLGGGLASTVQHLLDGPLGAFRNVTKFEPVLRLPLALGLVHALDTVALPRLPSSERVVGAAALAAVIAAAAWPLARGQVVAPGAFPRVPGYWETAAAWLHAHAGGGRTLLVPSTAFAEYDWGRPLDEPLQAMARSPWAVRSLVPLGSDGLTRMLDEIDARLSRGDAGPGFAPGLGRAGVRYLLVRNDLDAARTSAPPPVTVRDALAMAPGVRLVRSFGPLVSGRANSDRVGPDPATSTARYRALDVYEVADSAGLVTAYPSDPIMVSGGPENLFDVADRGAVVFAGERAAPAERLVTDGLRRRDVDFGDVRLTASYALTAHEPAPGTRRPPHDRLPVKGGVHQSTVRMTGAVTLRASSWGPGPGRLPELQPFAAFDGDPDSAWVAQGLFGPGHEWIEVGLDRAIDPGHLGVRLLDDRRWSRITRLKVVTDRGSRVTAMSRTGALQSIAVPPGTTRHVRVELDGVTGRFGAGLRDIAIPGVKIERPLAVPDDQEGTDPRAWMLRRAAADPYDATRSDEEPTLRRVITTSAPVTVAISGSARGRPGRALDALAAAGDLGRVRASATSTWKSIPAFAPASAFDNDDATPWVAAPSDKRPTLAVEWPEIRTIDTIDVTSARGPVRRPTRILLTSPDGERVVDLPAHGPATFGALRTASLAIKVLDAAPFPNHLRGLITAPAVGLAEIRFPALADLEPAPPPPTLDLPCGQGPTVLVDGRPVATEVRGSAAALRALRPLSIQACQPVVLAPGAHRVDGDEAGAFVIDSLTVASAGAPVAPAPTATRSVRIVTWGVEHRTIVVGPGGPTWLTLSENFNRGWRASVGGHELRPVRVDGWRQGFVLPATVDGAVTLSFGPGRPYRIALLGGALAVVLLAVAARARSSSDGEDEDDDDGVPAQARRLSLPSSVAAGLAVGFLVGGPTVVAVGLLAAVMARTRVAAPWIACAYVVAGAVAVWQPGRFPLEHAGTFSPVAQGFAALAIAALVLSLRYEET
jgi:arabinofuranan 3-O-arabinosyltransferase